MIQTDKLMTIKQLQMKYPFVSLSLLYFWIEEHQLAHYRLGRGKKGKIVVDEDDFLTLLTEKKVKPVECPPPARAAYRHLR